MAAVTPPPLRVFFVGTTIDLGDDETLTFGRTADLVIDENPYLHRVCGRLAADGGVWWLTNEGSRIVLSLTDAASPSAVTLAPGARAAVEFPRSTVRFRAGQTDYAFDLVLSDADALPEQPTSVPEEGDTTADRTQLEENPELTREQILLVLALAQHRLRAPHRPLEVPTNAQIAHDLDWSRKKFDGKLDRLCRRLSRAGVQGLSGDAASLASDRRRRLVEHAVESGLVSAADLSLLEDEMAEVRRARD